MYYYFKYLFIQIKKSIFVELQTKNNLFIDLYKRSFIQINKNSIIFDGNYCNSLITKWFLIFLCKLPNYF